MSILKCSTDSIPAVINGLPKTEKNHIKRHFNMSNDENLGGKYSFSSVSAKCDIIYLPVLKMTPLHLRTDGGC